MAEHIPQPYHDGNFFGGGGVKCSCGHFHEKTAIGRSKRSKDRRTMKQCWEAFRRHWVESQ